MLIIRGAASESIVRTCAQVNGLIGKEGGVFVIQKFA